MAKSFSGLITRYVELGKILGFKIDRSLPALTHSFLADDTVLFVKASTEEVDQWQDLLNVYCQASGQQISVSKPSVYFSSHVLQDFKTLIKDKLGYQEMQIGDLYLGLLVLWSASKKQTMSYLIDRVKKKIQGWKEKLLSFAGKEVLIKAVIQAIPIYAMTLFKLPKDLLNNIKVLIRQFW